VAGFGRNLLKTSGMLLERIVILPVSASASVVALPSRPDRLDSSATRRQTCRCTCHLWIAPIESPSHCRSPQRTLRLWRRTARQTMLPMPSTRRRRLVGNALDALDLSIQAQFPAYTVLASYVYSRYQRRSWRCKRS